MACNELVEALKYVLRHIWHIPEGFATLLAGTSALFAAIIAWRAVQNQITAHEKIEATKRRQDQDAFQVALTNELLCLSVSVIQATSAFNALAQKSPTAAVKVWQKFGRPRVYEAHIGKLGLVSEPWVAGAIISFYGNLEDLNDMAAELEPSHGPRTVGQNNRTIAARLQVMASNLAQSLEGLNADRKFSIPSEVDLNKLIAPDGTAIANATPKPTSIQALLSSLAGRQAA